MIFVHMYLFYFHLLNYTEYLRTGSRSFENLVSFRNNVTLSIDMSNVSGSRTEVGKKGSQHIIISIGI